MFVLFCKCQNLHDDLHEMLTDEVNSLDTNKIPVPSVLVMKAHGQRFITERSLNRPKKRLFNLEESSVLDESQTEPSFLNERMSSSKLNNSVGVSNFT